MFKKYVHVTREDNHVVYHTELGVATNSEGKVFENDKLCTQAFVQDSLRMVLGKTLTIVDASLSEAKQNKAVKDLIKQVFADQYGQVSDFLTDSKGIEAVMADMDESTLPQEVGIDEALGLK